MSVDGAGTARKCFRLVQRPLESRCRGNGAGEDAGFTLIELMVVLLILAILISIAIPTFLSVTGGANDRAAQSNLNTALTNAKAAAEEADRSYAGVTVGLMTSNEPAIAWTSGTVTSPGPVSMTVDTGNPSNGIVLAAYSKNNNTCWYIVDNLAAITATNRAYATLDTSSSPTSAPTDAGTYFGKQTGGTCTSAAAPTAATWSPISFTDLG